MCSVPRECFARFCSNMLFLKTFWDKILILLKCALLLGNALLNFAQTVGKLLLNFAYTLEKLLLNLVGNFCSIRLSLYTLLSKIEQKFTDCVSKIEQKGQVFFIHFILLKCALFLVNVLLNFAQTFCSWKHAYLRQTPYFFAQMCSLTRESFAQFCSNTVF